MVQVSLGSGISLLIYALEYYRQKKIQIVLENAWLH